MELGLKALPYAALALSELLPELSLVHLFFMVSAQLCRADASAVGEPPAELLELLRLALRVVEEPLRLQRDLLVVPSRCVHLIACTADVRWALLLLSLAYPGLRGSVLLVLGKSLHDRFVALLQVGPLLLEVLDLQSNQRLGGILGILDLEDVFLLRLLLSRFLLRGTERLYRGSDDLGGVDGLFGVRLRLALGLGHFLWE